MTESPINPWLLTLAQRWQAETRVWPDVLPAAWVRWHWDAKVTAVLAELRVALARQSRRARWRARFRRVLHPFH